MKKSITVIIIVVLSLIILVLSAASYQLHQSLEAASFTEATVVENTTKDGGIVTVSEDWLVYKDDSFIKDSSSPSSSTVEDVYCDLHKQDLMVSSQGNLSKLIFEKEVSITENGCEKIYYLVGDYYITSPVTTIYSDSLEVSEK